MTFRPQDAYNISDLRDRARRVLPRGLFEFVDRGTEDEACIDRNATAFKRIGLRPRVLVDVSERSLTTDFFGQASAMPLAVAPTGAAGLLWLDGEIAIARAAAESGIPFTLSTASIISMEKVASEAGGRLWFQLYMWPDRSMSYQLVDRAKRAGYEALVVTVDTAVTPNREYNRRNGFSLPMRITRRNIVDVAQHPGWFFSVFAKYILRSGIPMLENYPDQLRHKLTAKPGRQIGLPKNDSLQWSDLRELRKRWDGPLMIKGVLHPEDAKLALDCGVDGVIVSNHGGRNLDSAIAPIEALPQIADCVGHKIDVLLDSGVRRGSDIFKAVALGAKGVFVGRAPLWGVSAAGEAGALCALELLREEIDRVMGFTGCRSIDEISHELLWLEAGFGRSHPIDKPGTYPSPSKAPLFHGPVPEESRSEPRPLPDAPPSPIPSIGSL
ncbi:alpha-hydroxy-acid oxidizing protein [Alcaligenaceae bacterium]|nr:alpha-hydroxy-acid oxidizing protein [Alcaligenaceae bacterium]